MTTSKRRKKPKHRYSVMKTVDLERSKKLTKREKLIAVHSFKIGVMYRDSFINGDIHTYLSFQPNPKKYLFKDIQSNLDKCGKRKP